MIIQAIPKPGGDESSHDISSPLRPDALFTGNEEPRRSPGLRACNSFQANLEQLKQFKTKSTQRKLKLVLNRQDIAVFANNMDEYPDLQVAFCKQ